MNERHKHLSVLFTDQWMRSRYSWTDTDQSTLPECGNQTAEWRPVKPVTCQSHSGFPGLCYDCLSVICRRLLVSTEKMLLLELKRDLFVYGCVCLFLAFCCCWNILDLIAFQILFKPLKWQKLIALHLDNIVFILIFIL